jgi:hypothetical protein
VHFPQAADPDRLAQVHVAGNGGGADVEPVGRLRGEFVRVRGFDGVDPACLFWGRLVSFVVGEGGFGEQIVREGDDSVCRVELGDFVTCGSEGGLTWNLEFALAFQEL